MITAQARIEGTALALDWVLENTFGEPVYVFDQTPWSAPGPRGWDAGFSSSLAWACADPAVGVLFLQGEVPAPPSPPFPPLERVLSGATLLAPGATLARTLVAPLPLWESSPYARRGPGVEAYPVPVERARLVVDLVLRSRVFSARRHPTFEEVWQTNGHPMERVATELVLPEAVVLMTWLDPRQRFA